MNEFKENLKRKTSGKINISQALENLLIELMKGNITKKELMNITGIGDKGTIERKIEELVSNNPELLLLYKEYGSKKSKNFGGYSFRAEAIEMLRNDCSQTEMAQKIGINRRSFSTKIKKLQEENNDNILGKQLMLHANRKMKKIPTSLEELVKVNIMIDKYEEEFPCGKARYENRSTVEIQIKNIKKVLDIIETLRLEDGLTVKEISQKGIISEANYRKYKAQYENLLKILNANSIEGE